MNLIFPGVQIIHIIIQPFTCGPAGILFESCFLSGFSLWALYQIKFHSPLQWGGGGKDSLDCVRRAGVLRSREAQTVLLWAQEVFVVGWGGILVVRGASVYSSAPRGVLASSCEWD